MLVECRCGRRDLNPHGQSPPAPKAGASTDSATPAWRWTAALDTRGTSSQKILDSALEWRTRDYEGGVRTPTGTSPSRSRRGRSSPSCSLVSAGILTVIAIGGWDKFQGAKPVTVFYILVYLLFAFYVSRWNRGVLPVASALSVILIIFAAVAAPAWFARDKEGFDSPALPENLLGLLTLSLIPLALLLIVFAMRGFQQQWNIEAGSRADLEARGLLGEPGRPTPRSRREPSLAAHGRPRARDRGPRRHGALRGHRARGRRPARSAGLAFAAALPARRARGLHRRRSRRASRTRCCRRIPATGKRGVFERDRCGSSPIDGEVLEERAGPAGRLRRAPQPLVGRPRPAVLRRLRAVGVRVRAVHLHACRTSRSRRANRGARAARPGRACASRFPATFPPTRASSPTTSAPTA